MKRARLGHVWRGELYLQHTRHWLQASSKAFSVYTPFIKGVTWVCFIFQSAHCHWETKSSWGKPIKETFPEVNLLILYPVVMTNMTFNQLDYYFRTVASTSNGSNINIGRQFCRALSRIHFCITVKVNLGLLGGFLITGTLHCAWGIKAPLITQSSMLHQLCSPLTLSSLPLYCPLL